MVGGTAAEQTRRVLKNLSAVLEAAGASIEGVVKTTVYLKDLKTFGEMNAVYAEFFKAPCPARATIEAAGLPKGALVEIDAIATVKADQESF
jgi:2-iminobutanoate/2-iminopropanoate deaminase